MEDMMALDATIAQVWTEVLGTPVEPGSDFFALGGHSLLATQVLARVEALVGLRPSLRTLLDNPDLRSFTEAIRAQLASG